MDRKYKQKGYQEEQKEQRPRSKADSGFGSRPSPRIETRFTDIIRCSNCSSAVEVVGSVSFTDQCKKCQADLHSCKNCIFFDPSAHFECKKPIEARVAKKNERNMCMQFQIKVSVEKLQTTPKAPRPKEPPSAARQAFDALFKK